MDFTQYAGPSAEWTALEKTLPAVNFNTSMDPVKVRHAVNADREAASAQVMVELSPQLTIKTYSIPTRDGATLEARTYRLKSKPEDEKLPVYLFFHGGGFIFGTVSGNDAACALTAIKTGILVLNSDYRHTPEAIYPTAWNDAQDAFAWLHDNADELGVDPSKVIVGGVSAGGNLTAALVLEQHLGKSLTKYPKPAGQILMIPALCSAKTYEQTVHPKLKDPSKNSYDENEHAPVLPRTTIEFFIDLLKISDVDPKDARLNPGAATIDEVKGMAPTVFGVAGLDPLRDEALLYAKTLTEAGVPTTVTLFKGVPHGHRRFGLALKASQDWDDVVINGISWALEPPQATGTFHVKVTEH